MVWDRLSTRLCAVIDQGTRLCDANRPRYTPSYVSRNTLSPSYPCHHVSSLCWKLERMPEPQPFFLPLSVTRRERVDAMVHRVSRRGHACNYTGPVRLVHCRPLTFNCRPFTIDCSKRRVHHGSVPCMSTGFSLMDMGPSWQHGSDLGKHDAIYPPCTRALPLYVPWCHGAMVYHVCSWYFSSTRPARIKVVGPAYGSKLRPPAVPDEKVGLRS